MSIHHVEKIWDSAWVGHQVHYYTWRITNCSLGGLALRTGDRGRGAPRFAYVCTVCLSGSGGQRAEWATLSIIWIYSCDCLLERLECAVSLVFASQSIWESELRTLPFCVPQTSRAACLPSPLFFFVFYSRETCTFIPPLPSIISSRKQCQHFGTNCTVLGGLVFQPF